MTVQSYFFFKCLKIWFKEEKSWFSTLECQFSFCFHQSLSSSNLRLCLLETQVVTKFKVQDHFKRTNLPRALITLVLHCCTFFNTFYILQNTFKSLVIDTCFIIRCIRLRPKRQFPLTRPSGPGQS